MTADLVLLSVAFVAAAVICLGRRVCRWLADAMQDALDGAARDVR